MNSCECPPNTRTTTPGRDCFSCCGLCSRFPTSRPFSPTAARRRHRDLCHLFTAFPPPSGPDDKTLLPRFPIVIAGDVPFLITQWGGHSGPPQMPESHVAYFRKYGTLRAKPLMPSCKPFEALDAVINSRRWWLHFESDRVSRDEEQRKADVRNGAKTKSSGFTCVTSC